jgi:hypothetical protein
MSLYDLLPPNATTLERDFSRATSSLERVASPVSRIRTAKRTEIPDNVVPWLIYEYGLNELLPFLGNNQRRALAEGVLWQRTRGTPSALKTALGWIGFEPFVEESEAGTLRWAEFQLGLNQAPDDLEVTNGLIGVSRLSAPVRSNLFRVYSGYDHRRFLLDDHALSGGSWLCDHTGVYLRPDWPQLSFGREHDAASDFSDEGVGELGIERIHGMLGLYEDRFTLDNSQLDEFWHLSDVGSIVRSRLIFITYGPLANPGTDWSGGHWESVLGWNTTNSSVPALKFAKAGLYLSDGAILGDTNGCFSARHEKEFGAGPFLLSEGDGTTGFNILSQHESWISFEEWLERFDRKHHSATSVPAPSGALAAHHRETQRVLDYDDSFTLDLHLLDEYPLAQDLQALSRTHALNVLGAPVDPDTWASQIDWLPYPNDIARPSWQTVINWAEIAWDGHTDPALVSSRRPQWGDALGWSQLAWGDLLADVPTWDHHPTWGDVGAWQSLYASSAGRRLRAGLYLSDSDPLGSSNAVLGFASEQRFERGHATSGPVENRQGVATSQHTRTSQTAAARFPFTAWSQSNWAGDGAEAWATGGDPWNDESWQDSSWFQGAAGFWGDKLWAQRVAWNPTSLQIESAHSTYVDGLDRYHVGEAQAELDAVSQHTRVSQTSFRLFTLTAWGDPTAWTRADTPDWQTNSWTGDDTDAWTEGSQPWPGAGWTNTDWMLGVENGWASTEPWIDEAGQPWLPTAPDNDAAWNPTSRFIESKHQTLT